MDQNDMHAFRDDEQAASRISIRDQREAWPSRDPRG